MYCACVATTMLEELCKKSWIQHCCATLWRSRNKRNVESCWLQSLTGFKICATTPNSRQQHAQGMKTDATCNIQQCLHPFAWGLRIFSLRLQCFVRYMNYCNWHVTVRWVQAILKPNVYSGREWPLLKDRGVYAFTLRRLMALTSNQFNNSSTL